MSDQINHANTGTDRHDMEIILSVVVVNRCEVNPRLELKIILKCLILLAVVLFNYSEITAQLNTQFPNNYRNNKNLSQDILANFTNNFFDGILQARYKKPGWREFIVPDRLEMPEIFIGTSASHPRLLDKSIFQQAKIKVTQPPFKEWYQNIKQLAEKPAVFSDLKIKDIVEYAKANAFLYYLLDEQRYLHQAISILRKIPEPPPIIDWEGAKPNIGWGDFLQSAEALPDLCITFDLLFNQIPSDVKIDLEKKILGITQQLCNAIALTPKNNHVTVMSIAIAFVSFTIDEPQRYLSLTVSELYQTAISYLSESLGLISPDGGYGEGIYYAKYILNYISRFAVYLNKLYGIWLLDHPILIRMVNWILDNNKSSKSYTQFDDAFTTDFLFLPLIIQNTSSSIYWDNFFKNQPPFTGYSTNMVEAFLFYRSPKIKNSFAPFYPAKFYPDMGQLIFHDRQPNPRFFTSLIFEKERYFSDVHEHIDPISMEISAFEQDFIIDGGYGPGTLSNNRPYFISPNANSTILVDGYGTNPNPLSGDELEGHLSYGFSTEKFAAAKLTHWIGDVQISRQIFYSGKYHILIFDEMEGNLPHTYTVQLHHNSKFFNRNFGKFSLQRNNIQMDVHLFSDHLQDWQLFESLGLGTEQSSAFEHGLLHIQSGKIRKNSLATLWVASKEENNNKIKNFPLLEGTGEWRQISDFKENSIEDFIWNTDDKITTPFCQSNGKLIWLKYSSPSDPQGILMVYGTFLQFGIYRIKTDSPLIIYLEKQKNTWTGYIYFDSKIAPLTLNLSGFAAVPFRVNGKPTEYKKRDATHEILISHPGTIDLGTGPSLIDLPQTHLEESNLLSWINRRPKIRRNAAYWTAYENMIFKNQITHQLIDGLGKVNRNWGNSLFGDSLIFEKTANVVQGLLQYNYRASNDGKGFRIPHYYNMIKEFSGCTWNIKEEGDWRSTGPKIRDFWVTGETNDSIRMSYRLQKPYQNFQKHKIQMEWKKTISIQNRYLKSNDVHIQDYSLLVQKTNWSFRPYLLVQNKNPSYWGLDSRLGYFQGSFRASTLGSDPIYSQLFSGRLTPNHNWILQGEQTTHFQKYQAYFSGKMDSFTYYTSGISTTIQSKPLITDGYLGFTGWKRNFYYYQNLQYYQKEWQWGGGISYSNDYHYLSTDMKLTNGSSGNERFFQFHMNRYLPLKIYWNLNINHSFYHVSGLNQTEIHQQSYIPLTEKCIISPLWEFSYGNEIRTTAWGSGLSILDSKPIYLQFILYRQFSPVMYRTDLTTEIPFPGNQPCNISGTLLWTKNRIHYSEIRLQQFSNNSLNPGIYYRYLFPREKRLEGFLEWRW